MNKEIMITQQDLIDWLDRPPSNNDLDLINFIVCRLDNFYKLEEENERLNNVINELEKWVKENNVNDRDIYGYEMEDTKVIYLEDFLDKLKALKEGK